MHTCASCGKPQTLPTPACASCAYKRRLQRADERTLIREIEEWLQNSLEGQGM